MSLTGSVAPIHKLLASRRSTVQDGKFRDRGQRIPIVNIVWDSETFTRLDAEFAVYTLSSDSEAKCQAQSSTEVEQSSR